MSSPDRDFFPYFEVLRLGHRPQRDKRITTHVALLSRAFGAKGIHIDTVDRKLEETVKSVSESFGGDFFIETGCSRKGLIRKWPGTIVHLTMYGAPLEKVMERIPKEEKVLIIVGAEKVPRDVYDSSHFNVSVANQPHSEVSALALFIDRLCDGKQLSIDLKGGTSTILPDDKGKRVISSDVKVDHRYIDPFERVFPPVPSRDTCFEIMDILGISEPVIDHVRSVSDLGMKMISGLSDEKLDELDIDTGLLEAGLLLHDIGRSVTHSIKHVDKGFEIASGLGLDSRICMMIRNHIGAGVTAEEAEDLGLVPGDHTPMTIMEKIVCHADNLVGDRKRRTIQEAARRLEDKGAVEAANRMKELHDELSTVLGIDLDHI